MGKSADGQVEFVLENRQLLVAFLALAVVCGIFFALGYIVGRNAGEVLPVAAQSGSESASSASKPSPVSSPIVPKEEEKSESGGTAEASGSTDLNFYEKVEEKKPDTALIPPETPEKKTIASSNAEAPEQEAASAEPEYLVQVSALTRRQDANALVSVIKDKRLPISIINGPNDSLFHVVVGPYKSLEEAEKIKLALEKDGFRPIVKR